VAAEDYLENLSRLRLHVLPTEHQILSGEHTLSDRYFQSPGLAAAKSEALSLARAIIKDADQFRDVEEVFQACSGPLAEIGAVLYRDHRIRYWSLLRNEKIEGAKAVEAAIIVCAVGVAVDGHSGAFWIQAAETGGFAEVLEVLDAESIAKNCEFVATIFAITGQGETKEVSGFGPSLALH
jgi:hypothetical protein